MPFERLEKAISLDRKGVFTLISLASTIGIYINSTRLSSLYVGILFSIFYFSINSVFAGNVLFIDESPSSRFLFGLLVLLMLIALGGTAIVVAGAVISVRFDSLTTTALLALLTVATSFFNHTGILTKILKES